MANSSASATYVQRKNCYDAWNKPSRANKTSWKNEATLRSCFPHPTQSSRVSARTLDCESPKVLHEDVGARDGLRDGQINKFLIAALLYIGLRLLARHAVLEARCTRGNRDCLLEFVDELGDARILEGKTNQMKFTNIHKSGWASCAKRHRLALDPLELEAATCNDARIQPKVS